MPLSVTHQKFLLAELALKINNPTLALSLFTRLSLDAAIQRNLYLYSSVLFNLGICHVFFECYDLAYVQFMKANTVWPNSSWAPFAIENSDFCIEKLGGEELALEQFRKKDAASRNIDNFLSMAYHAYYLKTVYEKALDKNLKQIEEIIKIVPSQKVELTETAYKKSIAVALKTSLFYLNHAFKLNPNDTIVLKFIVSLQQEMHERDITEWRENDIAFYNLATYFRKQKQPHKAQKIYHDWFETIEKKRLVAGTCVSMLSLLDLEAECYEEMGYPQLALKTLQRQATLFSTPNNLRTENIQNKQKALDANYITPDLPDNNKRRISAEVCNITQASLAEWNSHPNIRPGIGYLRFFTSDESNTKESSVARSSIRPNRSYGF